MLMTSENCPQCKKKLPPPFKSSGRQVCSGCGWTNKPKSAKVSPLSVQKNVEPLPQPEAETKQEPVVSTKLNLSINQQSIELDLVYLSGIAGSIILFFGIFTPLISLPVVGSVSLTNGSVKAIITTCVVASFTLTLKKMYKWLTLTGLGAALTISYIFLDFLVRIEDAKSNIDTELSGNPFRGLADVAVDSIHLDWGWIILFLGVGLILNSPRLAKFINYKQMIGGFFLSGLVVFILFSTVTGIKASGSTQQARQFEGKNNVGALIRAEQAYRLDNDKFADNFTELDVSYLSEDSTYYRLEISDADKDKVIVVAKSKEEKHNLKSFAEAVSYDSSNYTYERISCETEKPSTSINLPVLSSNKWSCGSNSIERE